MIRSLLVVVALSIPLTAAAQMPPPAPPPGMAWRIVANLSDEFDGERLDVSKWLPYQPYYAGRPPSRFERSNVVVRNGELELRSSVDEDYLPVVRDPVKDIWVLTSCVTSLRPTASYGYYEARLKPSRISVASAFWLQGKNSEIDIVEHIGGSTRYPDQAWLMQMNTHYGFRENWKYDKATPLKWKMPVHGADDFHVYGAWWKDADTIWFYFDGQKVGELKPVGPFIEPMYLFLDTEVFKDQGLPTVESLRDPALSTMRVDWVRSWTLEAVKQ